MERRPREWAQRRRIAARHLIVAAAMMLFAGSASPLAAQLQDAPQSARATDFGLRLEVRAVDLWIAVADRRGRPVDALQAANFRVFEDDHRQRIDSVVRASALPLSLAVVLDTSPTMTEGGVIDAAVTAIADCLPRIVRPQDRAGLLTFRRTLFEQVAWTDQVAALRAGLEAAQRESQHLSAEGTAVRDSLIEALDRLAQRPGRRAIVLVTDGRDNASDHDHQALAARLGRGDARLYVLLVGRRQLGNRLPALAAKSGGRAFRARFPEAISSTLRAIERELAGPYSGQYVVSYRSSHADDARCREIGLDARRDGRSLRVRSIGGYCPQAPVPKQRVPSDR